MLAKTHVRKTILSTFGCKVSVSSNCKKSKMMHKETFIKVIERLQEIEKRTEFLYEEVGIDLTSYEEDFFHIIEDLLGLLFNKQQITLIQTYLYQLSSKEVSDGVIIIKKGDKEQEYAFDTPESVWELVMSFK